MPTVTRLVAGKKNQSRVNIYLDGRFALAISLDDVVRQGLRVGLELSEDAITKLKEDNDQARLYAKILNFISYRPRSVVEVKNRLAVYGIRDSQVVEEIVHKLETQGYVDDMAFARWFVDSRSLHRPRSKRHLTAELRAKGIGSEVINTILGGLDEREGLRALITKKSKLSRESLIALLLRRGFGYGLIKQQLDEMGIRE